MTKFVLTVAVSLSIASVAFSSAAIYRWVDDHGVVSFAEDFGKIPEKYRNSATVVGEDRGPEIVTVKEETGGGEKKGSASGVVTERDSQKGALYGGKDELQWKREFANQKTVLDSYQSQLDSVKERMSNPQMSRSDYRVLENTGKLLEVEVAKSRKKLDEMNAAADKAGVPKELR